MSLAENPRAVIGGNFPPPEEKLPPVAERVITTEDVHVMRVVVRLLATRIEIAKWKLTEKRKGGLDGRAARCFAIGYMRGIGFPMWKLRKMWDLDRKQMGQEEDAFISMRTQDAVDRNLDHVEGMLDEALKIDLEELMPAAESAYQDILDKRRDAKKTRQTVKKALAENPPPPPPPKLITEADRILAENERKRRLNYIDGQIKIAKAVIVKGDTPKATKEARRDALAEVKKLDAYMKERKKLTRAPQAL